MNMKFIPDLALEKVKGEFLRRLNLTIEVRKQVSRMATDIILVWRNSKTLDGKYTAQTITDGTALLQHQQIFNDLIENMVDKLEEQMFAYVPQRKFGRWIIKLLKKYRM